MKGWSRWLRDGHIRHDAVTRKGQQRSTEKAQEIMAHLQGTKQNNGLRDLAEDSPDFSNPTEEMVLQAKRMGVDLTDPDVQGYLKYWRVRKERSLKQHVEEPPVAVNWSLIVAVIVVLWHTGCILRGF